MTAQQIQLIRSSWQLTAEEPLKAAISFYDQLFSLSPQLRGLFRSPMSGQTMTFMKAIGYLVNRLENIYEIGDEFPDTNYLSQAYGLQPKHFAEIKDALLWTIEKSLGSSWNDETREAWLSCYEILTEFMVSEEIAA
jgi:hemoglobin-like flavoprotein